MGAIVAERFVHIAEEAPINPSLLLSLAGCGMRCRFCQQGDLLDPSSVSGEPVEPLLWRRLRCRGARSLSFAGGNPDESLYGVLRFLRAAPEDWALPLVWNCHGFGTRETVALLDGVVDVYVPDFKYGSSACARRLSGCAGYPSAARASVRRMLAQGAVVIARVLVLPGHLECCHLPALRMLSAMSDSRLQVSIRGQYAPDWKVVPGEGLLGRRATEREVASVREAAIEIGLTLVE
jgi:putative pyruvate formate lyase activating enzyme